MKWFRSLFTKALTESPTPEDTPFAERARQLAALGSKMAQAEDFSGAMKAFESALRLDSRCAFAWQERGRAFLAQTQTLEALASFARALELEARNPASWQGMGVAILKFLKDEKDTQFIREHRLEIVSEAHDCLVRAQNLGANQPELQTSLTLCQDMIGKYSWCVVQPRLFSFQPGGLLEKAKREVVSPLMKPSDFRRKPIPEPEK